ncbi:MAG TPA: hypothetical protein VFO40_22590, partial [Chthoniobacterales bacterium]|nr:hypothetical protein [Chthoniobacterales bacterium]
HSTSVLASGWTVAAAVENNAKRQTPNVQNPLATGSVQMLTGTQDCCYRRKRKGWTGLHPGSIGPSI